MKKGGRCFGHNGFTGVDYFKMMSTLLPYQHTEVTRYDFGYFNSIGTETQCESRRQGNQQSEIKLARRTANLPIPLKFLDGVDIQQFAQ